MFNKPFAQSCEENKSVILNELLTVFLKCKNVLELGSGTGQHAVYFAKHLPHLNWQPSELEENINGIKLWMEEVALNNINEPKIIDVVNDDWFFSEKFDGAFTANTLHIMSIKHVENIFTGVSKYLAKGGSFCCYGPFNKNGQFTSDSNAKFDIWLKQRDAKSGIRDMSELISFAEAVGIALVDDIEMPANNRLLVWKKI